MEDIINEERGNVPEQQQLELPSSKEEKAGITSPKGEEITSSKEEDLLRYSGGETETGQESYVMNTTTKEAFCKINRKERRNMNSTRERREETEARQEAKQLLGKTNPRGEGSQAKPNYPEQTTPPGRPQDTVQPGPNSRNPNKGSQEGQGTGGLVSRIPTSGKPRGPMARQVRRVEKETLESSPLFVSLPLPQSGELKRRRFSKAFWPQTNPDPRTKKIKEG